MARRPRGKKNSPEAEAKTEEQGVGPGHNSTPEPLTDEERRALAYHHKRFYVAALAAKKKADAELKNVAKKAKGDEIPVSMIKHLIALDTEEGRAKIEAEIAEAYKAAAWAGVGFGAQSDLFAQPDRTPLADKARASGEVAAMNGDDCDPPYDHGSELGQAWITGWQAGQGVMASLFKKLETSAPIVQHIEAAEEGDAKPEGEGLSDEVLDAVLPTPPAPPTAATQGFDENGDPIMPGFLRRTPALATEPA